MQDAAQGNGWAGKRRWAGAMPVIAGVGLAAALTASAALAVYQTRFPAGYVQIGDDLKVAVTVAATPATQEKGLSGREGLQPDEGMLFIFDRLDTYAFWMKDMRFPIDIIWIRDGVIADITTDVPVPVPGQELPVYFPRIAVDRVLEVGAGFAKAHGLRTGEAVTAHVDKGK
ncbi:MAG: hypothetical protein RL272_1085 [Candidatus Parcubacteria bacterium]|jgi:uncharacterized membrane protein (UPF0127 family)